MLRFILILLTLYFLWRVIKIIGRMFDKGRITKDQSQIKQYPFENVEDAKYEDITDKDKKKET
ncbi:MAG: hypothetical protein Q8K98_11210 [Bacteroidota bacterium]|nr:hypothetical protein [Bacteroidota bacterium]